ncbi:hypothetical protein F8M41_012005 [Gigaspora margarita]|uniref:Uncharacterized protein n=1 Tax=Gigaspora margarita TaxID=4874 RepID=A0A8H4EPU0_GIGMA|nr:hypothetical protein F8M41_012005 [Gigaspora margarita]
MTHTRTLKQKFAIHPGRIRRSHLLLHKQTRLVADNSQDVSINNILNDSYSILEDILTNNNDFEDSNESDGNIEYSNENDNVSINDGNSEDSSEDKYNNLEDISDSPEDSNEDDDFRDNNNDFEDISIDSDDFEGSNDNFEDNNISDLKNNSDGSLIDDNSSTQKIADRPASFEPFNGEYGPYLANFTEQMLFLWVTKHMITTKAYEDLIIIIKHPQFQLRHVPKNVRRLRSQRTKMPLLNIKSHTISINDWKTPSTSKPTKLVYTISIKEHLSCVLNNPRLMAKMYFGRGVETEYAVGQFVEFIYTNSNSQSKNRFGRIEAIVSQSESESNHSDTQIKDALKMSRLLSHNELGIYCSHDRSCRGHNELWIIEENYQIIPSSYIIRHVSIWIKDLP